MIHINTNTPSRENLPSLEEDLDSSTDSTSVRTVDSSFKPNYVSFIPPEFLSPRLERKRTRYYRWPMLLIRWLVLVTSIGSIVSVFHFIDTCGISSTTCWLAICGVLSTIIAITYLTNWARRRICYQPPVLLDASKALDCPVNERIPLLLCRPHRHSRAVLHLLVHLTISLFWAGALLDLYLRRNRCYVSNGYLGCSVLYLSTSLVVSCFLSWVTATILIILDIKRREF
ncbi:hypothetical protein K493DRAFT_310194 [Basidiobolus meristosporus CBS 931.73]|uniref:Uncharacterized protein n=1 Tax=Basidiobolus meristosporus CBS 931.73 TaxID=1314790 RepID=A0A1Y1ZCC9_9FUNG|nr:hypothetical protein K493DRAFT_310194 [Basidiobolus meristosporus CBS 931.73]|eukprot:ORY07455.1 hypothetical protein K493DRAFT_310194 [Basidiobolus meristosporus CBS 931.73]